MKNKFWFVGVGLSLTVLAVYVLAAGSITTQSGDITLNPASGKVFVNGSLGVGTTNPAADLEISSSNNSKRKQLRLSQNGNLGV